MDIEVINSKLSEAIRIGRAKKRLSKEAMSKQLSMSVQTYRNLEERPTKYSVLLLYKISEILDCDLLAVFETEKADNLSC